MAENESEGVGGARSLGLVNSLITEIYITISGKILQGLSRRWLSRSVLGNILLASVEWGAGGGRGVPVGVGRAIRELMQPLTEGQRRPALGWAGWMEVLKVWRARSQDLRK